MADKRDSMELELEMILRAWDQEEEESNVCQIEKEPEKEESADAEIKEEKPDAYHEEISEELNIDVSDMTEKQVKIAETKKEGDLKEKKAQKKEKPPKKKNTPQKGKISKKKKVLKKKSSSRKGFKIVVTVLMGFILVVVVLAACAMGIYWKGKNHMTSSGSMKFRIPEAVTASSDNNGKIVSYENKDYRRRTGTTNILLIGKNQNSTFSTVVVNFDEKSNSFRSIAIPASLLAIDYSSAMNYSDIADYVSDYLCGLPIQGYMVLDMQVVDAFIEAEEDQITDYLQLQKLIMFINKVTDSASENWLVPVKVMKMFGDSFRTNMSIADLSYVYRLYVTCSGLSEDEFTESTDVNMFFQRYLNTFYDEK